MDAAQDVPTAEDKVQHAIIHAAVPFNLGAYRHQVGTQGEVSGAECCWSGVREIKTQPLQYGVVGHDVVGKRIKVRGV